MTGHEAVLTDVGAGRVCGSHVSGCVFLQQPVSHQPCAALQKDGLGVRFDSF